MRDEIYPGLFSNAPNWVKFSEYELIQNTRGAYYVIPKKEATMMHYSPFQVKEELLKAFLTMAKTMGQKHLEKKKIIESDDSEPNTVEEILKSIEPNEKKNKKLECIEREIATAALRFANSYGLLGLFFQYAFDIEVRLNPMDHNKTERIVRRNKGGLLLYFGQGKDLQYDEYAEKFFPRYDAPYPICTGKTQTDFWRNYAEPTIVIFYEAMEFWAGVKTWEGFRKSGALPEDEYTQGQTWANKFRSFGEWPIGLRLEFDSVWQLAWVFQSLISALKIIFLNDITSKYQKVRVCNNCNQPFIATAPNAECCGVSCGSSDRQKVYQSRKREGKRLWKQGKTIGEISDITKSKNTTVEKWIKEFEGGSK